MTVPKGDASGGAAHVLAIDLGTSGLKLALATTEGRIVGSAVEPYALHILPGGGAEQDAEEWWRAVVRACRRILGETGVDPWSVVGAACSSQWSGTVPVDRDGATARLTSPLGALRFRVSQPVRRSPSRQ